LLFLFFCCKLYYGVRGIPLQWFVSYLCERKQQLKLKNITIFTKKILPEISQNKIKL